MKTVSKSAIMSAIASVSLIPTSIGFANEVTPTEGSTVAEPVVEMAIAESTTLEVVNPAPVTVEEVVDTTVVVETPVEVPVTPTVEAPVETPTEQPVEAVEAPPIEEPVVEQPAEQPTAAPEVQQVAEPTVAPQYVQPVAYTSYVAPARYIEPTYGTALNVAVKTSESTPAPSVQPTVEQAATPTPEPTPEIPKPEVKVGKLERLSGQRKIGRLERVDAELPSTALNKRNIPTAIAGLLLMASTLFGFIWYAAKRLFG